MARSRRHRWLVMTVAGALALVACSTGRAEQAAPLPPPPSTQATTTTVVPPDLSQTVLPSVRGATTTTTVALGPGPATVSGTVSGPGGPVPGATVRIERFVGDEVASAEVLSTDGTWSLPSVAGGRYRVRAWRVPDLAQVEPTLVFVDARQPTPVALKLATFSGPFPSPALAPNPPVVGAAANLVVLVAQRSVDSTGVVRAVPMPGAQVALAGTGGWQVRSINPTVTDATGKGRWELQCRTSGAQPLSITVSGVETFPLTLPACVDPFPVAEPTIPDAPTSSIGSAPTTRPATTTTTTRRRSRSSGKFGAAGHKPPRPAT